jgi:hypothetical protein
MGFELTITAYERAKTVHALDSSATVTGLYLHLPYSFMAGCLITELSTGIVLVFGDHIEEEDECGDAVI